MEGTPDDTLIRKSNNTTGGDLRGGDGVANRVDLFTVSTSSLSLTNFGSAQTFPSDQTFVVLAYRVWLFFMSNLRDSSANGVAQQGDFHLYQEASAQLYWTHVIGDKTQFTGPTWYFPAGGGIDGFVADTSIVKLNNGEEGQDHILKLAKPILLPPRQGCKVTADLIDMNDSFRTDVNAATGQVDIKFMLDSANGATVPTLSN